MPITSRIERRCLNISILSYMQPRITAIAVHCNTPLIMTRRIAIARFFQRQKLARALFKLPY
jgi:hypothetical protein